MAGLASLISGCVSVACIIFAFGLIYIDPINGCHGAWVWLMLIGALAAVISDVCYGKKEED